MFSSIRFRIALNYILLILVLIAGMGGYSAYYIRQTYLSDISGNLALYAKIVADDVIPALRDAAAAESTINERAHYWSDVLEARVTIIAPDGTVLGDSHENPAEMDNHLNRPEVVEARKSGKGESTRLSRTVGYQMMYVAVQIVDAGRFLGFARAALPLTDIQTTLAHLGNASLISALVASLFAILLSAVIVRRITRPLVEVTEDAMRLATDMPALPSVQETTASLISRPHDEISRLSFALRSLARHQQAQIDALSREQIKLSAVLEQMTDGVIIADGYGNIQLINPAALRIFDIQQADALGHSLAEALRSHQVVDTWQVCHEKREIQTAPLELPSRKITAQILAIPLTDALPEHALLLIQDLTRLRQLETVRRDFISNISHELRTPLASLKALAETLLDSALEDPPAARRFLQRMETEVDALSLMVSELLELSRIESGRVPLSYVAFSPEAILHTAEERLRLQAERAGLSVSFQIEPGLPDVLADKPRIEQVIVNLLHNAIKFTPAGGTIILHARLHQAPGFVEFAIQDSGVGIPAAALPRIFERFYKADRARSGGGTGLGLAIARHLVEAHHGSIWVASQENTGSTFFFTLPINPTGN